MFQRYRIFLEESNLLSVMAPINICCDIHGQFYDLQGLMREGGSIPDFQIRTTFISDFVNRGYNSVESIEYLLYLKVKYLGNLILLRGNHGLEKEFKEVPESGYSVHSKNASPYFL